MTTIAASRYQVSFKPLTEEERTKEVVRQVTEEVEVPQPSETLSSQQSSQNSSANSPLPNISLGKRIHSQIDTSDQKGYQKRQKLDQEDNCDPPTQMTTPAKITPSSMKDRGYMGDYSPTRTLEFNLYSSNKGGSDEDIREAQSNNAEIGSTSRTDNQDDLTRVTEEQRGVDVTDMFLSRSPEHEKQEYDPGLVCSQDYHQMLLNNTSDKESAKQPSPQQELSKGSSQELINTNCRPAEVQAAKDQVQQNSSLQLEQQQLDQQDQQIRKREEKTHRKSVQVQSTMKVQKQREVVTKEIQQENMLVSVKDCDTLMEYEGRVKFNFDFLPKLGTWVSKKRYKCIEHVTDDKLTVKVDIFTFQLHAKKHDDAKWLLSEIKQLREERKSIMKDIKLFQYFFFNTFNEFEFRKNILPRVTSTQLEKYIENPEKLFIVKEALGVREITDGHCQSQLAFTEDMCFDEDPQRYQSPFTDKLYVSGPDLEYQVCPLWKKQPSSARGVQSDTLREIYKYKYDVGLAVSDNEKYQVYFPKRL